MIDLSKTFGSYTMTLKPYKDEKVFKCKIKKAIVNV